MPDSMILTPSDRQGRSRSALYRAARDGQLDRIARGLYVPTGVPPVDWDWLEAATRRPEATICLTSALAHHNLIDVIPDSLDVALPRGTRIPASARAIRWHSFDRATFEIGRTETTIAGSDSPIGLYSAERCIADAFRLRAEIGYEVARDALKEWLRRGGAPAQLAATALRLPRAKGPLLLALDLLA